MPAGRPATIFVLEKNAAARELIDQALRESGDRILVTDDPNEAIELARRVRVDLLVSDVTLLHHYEQPFLKHLRSIERGLRVLYLDSRNGQGFVEAEDGVTLHTPFSLDELREAVADLLGRHT